MNCKGRLERSTWKVFSDDPEDPIAGNIGAPLEAEELEGIEVGEVFMDVGGAVVPALFPLFLLRLGQKGSGVYA